jgi:hypothetical protein
LETSVGHIFGLEDTSDETNIIIGNNLMDYGCPTNPSDIYIDENQKNSINKFLENYRQ